MGLNYADHAKEGGNARPEFPSFFLRGNSSMVGHNQAIVRPKASTQLDYEAELAVIIGKKARHLTADNALDCIAGYSCFNDGSIRRNGRLVKTLMARARLAHVWSRQTSCHRVQQAFVSNRA